MRSCIFCGKTNLTKEHILPKWLQGYWGQMAGGLHVIEKANGDSIQFVAKAFDQTARIVCESCNSGWMAQIEAETAKILGPMITGPGVGRSLNLEEQSILARWAVKTLIVLEYANSDNTNHIPPTIPRRLFDLHALLPELTVYLGFREEAYGVGGKHAAGYVVQQPTKVQCKPLDKYIMSIAQNSGKKVFSAALVVGHVYFYMLGTDINEGYVFLHPKEPHFLRELWPDHAKSDINWPTTLPIEIQGNWNGFTTEMNKKVSIDFYK